MMAGVKGLPDQTTRIAALTMTSSPSSCWPTKEALSVCCEKPRTSSGTIATRARGPRIGHLKWLAAAHGLAKWVSYAASEKRPYPCGHVERGHGAGHVEQV
jgi:hypothetical protein